MQLDEEGVDVDIVLVCRLVDVDRGEEGGKVMRGFYGSGDWTM